MKGHRGGGDISCTYMHLVAGGMQQLAVCYLLMKPALIRTAGTATTVFDLTSHELIRRQLSAEVSKVK
jgi:hypothetical protein